MLQGNATRCRCDDKHGNHFAHMHPHVILREEMEQVQTDVHGSAHNVQRKPRYSKETRRMSRQSASRMQNVAGHTSASLDMRGFVISTSAAFWLLFRHDLAAF